MTDKTGGGDFFAGFIVGALVGAAAALLFAPQSGEQTRTMIRDKGIEIGEQADRLSVEARKRAEELQIQAKERAGTLSTQARDTADGLQDKMKSAIEEGKTAATQKKEELLSQLKRAEASDEAPAEA